MAEPLTPEARKATPTPDEFLLAALAFSRIADQYGASVTDEYRRDRILDASRLVSKLALDEVSEVDRLIVVEQQKEAPTEQA